MDNEATSDLRKAQVDTRNSLQRLTNLLEKKGIVTAQELAVVYGEAEAPTYKRNMDQN